MSLSGEIQLLWFLFNQFNRGVPDLVKGNLQKAYCHRCFKVLIEGTLLKWFCFDQDVWQFFVCDACLVVKFIKQLATFLYGNRVWQNKGSTSKVNTVNIH